MSMTSAMCLCDDVVSDVPPRPRTYAVRVAGLTKRFANRTRLRDLLRGRRREVVTVVDGVTFDVRAGEVFGLLGPNGAGKTTIFKMLSTMIVPDAGTASICGRDVHADSARVRHILAAVPADERSLNWRLSATENLLLFAALHGLRARDAAHRVDQLLRIVDLDDSGSKLVGAFSSGMRQRLLIARALLSQPRVLLLDEPTRALDPISAQEFRAFLRQQLVSRLDCTIVLATHNTDEALGFCDRLLVLNRGRVLATGSAAELRSRYYEERYRLLTADPTHECLTRLASTAAPTGTWPRLERTDDWTHVECVIPGDPSACADVLRHLVNSGVRIARFERVEPSLADLIGRIIGAANEGRINA